VHNTPSISSWLVRWSRVRSISERRILRCTSTPFVRPEIQYTKRRLPLPPCLLSSLYPPHAYVSFHLHRQRLFLATGYGVIQAVRAMMSFEDADLLSAQEDAKHGLTVAASHRKKAPNFTSRLAGFVTGAASGTAWIKTMTAVERHAELVYAETLLEKVSCMLCFPYTF
jgi:hypothetical protein